LHLPWALSFPANFERFTGIRSSPFPYLSNFGSPPAEPGVYPLLISKTAYDGVVWVGSVGKTWDRKCGYDIIGPTRRGVDPIGHSSYISGLACPTTKGLGEVSSKE